MKPLFLPCRFPDPLAVIRAGIPRLSFLVTAVVLLSGCRGPGVIICRFPSTGRPADPSVLFQCPLPPGSEAPAEGSPFEDVTEKLGIALGGCAAWADFDNDGWVDVFGGGTLWRNNEGKSFTKVGGVPLSGDKGTWGDFNNDGLLDLFTADNGRLYRALPGGGFKDVSPVLPERGEHISRAATWGDVNGDGFLDLYYSGYEVWEPAKDYHDFIYLNEGGLSFRKSWQTPRFLRARGATAADFDRDGDLDIYVSNYRLQPNNLWRNDGSGGFADAGGELGVAGDGDLGAWGHTIGSSWGDLDNDGWLDLFVGNFSHPPAYQDRPKFLRNLGPDKDFKFEDKSAGAGLAWQESFASPTLGDYDNDGDLDLYFTAVYGGNHNVLYRNDGNWTFTNVTDKAGLTRQSTYQAAWMDYDNDGCLDLATGGRIYRNRGNGGSRMRIRLVGGEGVNHTAIGAQIRIRLGDKVVTRQVEGSTGEGNQNDLTCHVGLGDATGPVDVEVHWPDGAVDSLSLPVNHYFVIRRRPKAE